MKPFSLSLNKSKSASTPTLKKPVTFGSLDDDEPIDVAPTSSAADQNVSANKRFLAQNAALNTKAMQKRMEKELKVDETVYDYDAVRMLKQRNGR
ncbi:hypothetical protein E1B28_008839 [Marasmius oreades]|uniref:Uncharacterized protein n=1 Tax=Marasmius oreades TaxID=181124 RepID=A0A9P7RZC7_9AGAR|nr:uncharacterized protein E1B28_008839 [Marasmius oreades]KAG7092487.1 hypothetical protein E1B28_008839 [Marasmius oreades]